MMQPSAAMLNQSGDKGCDCSRSSGRELIRPYESVTFQVFAHPNSS
jgi:hypothetical protein